MSSANIGNGSMALPEAVEDYRHYPQPTARPPAETSKNYEIEPGAMEVSSASAWYGLITLPLQGMIAREGFDVRPKPEGSVTQTLYRPSIDEFRQDDSATDGMGLQGDFRRVVQLARIYTSEEVAARLVKIEQEPVEEGNIPLQPSSARWFVRYCLGKGIRGRPLMTVTPTGELDATWKCEEETIVARFFPDGTVWVALRLEATSGSFKATVNQLVSKSFPIRFPAWANG